MRCARRSRRSWTVPGQGRVHPCSTWNIRCRPPDTVAPGDRWLPSATCRRTAAQRIVTVPRGTMPGVSVRRGRSGVCRPEPRYDDIPDGGDLYLAACARTPPGRSTRLSRYVRIQRRSCTHRLFPIPRDRILTCTNAPERALPDGTSLSGGRRAAHETPDRPVMALMGRHREGPRQMRRGPSGSYRSAQTASMMTRRAGSRP
jgi:hypothetical protein